MRLKRIAASLCAMALAVAMTACNSADNGEISVKTIDLKEKNFKTVLNIAETVEKYL